MNVTKSKLLIYVTTLEFALHSIYNMTTTRYSVRNSNRQPARAHAADASVFTRSHPARARAPISRTASTSFPTQSISFTIVAVASRNSWNLSSEHSNATTCPSSVFNRIVTLGRMSPPPSDVPSVTSTVHDASTILGGPARSGAGGGTDVGFIGNENKV